MYFWSFYLNFWYWLYLTLVPVLIFSVKPKSRTWIKSALLVFLIFILPFLIMLLDYAKQNIDETYQGKNYGCWIYDFYFFMLASFTSIIYTGWWELAWRCYYKQISWRIKGDLKNNIISNSVIFISGFVTLSFLLMVLGCKPCSYFIFDMAFSIKKFSYFELVPLLC
jgi:hypothetical protein